MSDQIDNKKREEYMKAVSASITDLNKLIKQKNIDRLKFLKICNSVIGYLNHGLTVLGPYEKHKEIEEDSSSENNQREFDFNTEIKKYLSSAIEVLSIEFNEEYLAKLKDPKLANSISQETPANNAVRNIYHALKTAGFHAVYLD